MATTRPAYAPDLTNDVPLPVDEALARVYPSMDRRTTLCWMGRYPRRGYQSDELARCSTLASNHTRDTGRQYARWHTPLAT